MSRMRVLYCTDTYPPQVNGVSVVTALSLQGLQQRGWQCAVIAPKYPAGMDNPFESAASEIDVLRVIPSVPMPTYPDIRLAAPDYFGVLQAARRFKPDIIHSATEFIVGRMGQMAARATGAPLVTSYHTDFSKYVSAYGLPAIEDVVSSYITRFHRRAARTYTPSVPAKGDLRRMGVPHVEVWGRGVDTALFHPSRRTATLRERLNLSPDTFVFVHVGRLAKEKSVDVILDAYRIVRERIHDVPLHLVIAGTGPCEPELRQRAPDNTTFLGHLDRRTALPEFYASSEAFLFSSLTETLGLVVLEAMSSGLPVIAAPAGGVADHLRHDWNGLAYPALDVDALAGAMANMVMHPELRHRLASGARQTAEPLSWERELDRLDASYHEVIFGCAERERHPSGERQPASHKGEYRLLKREVREGLFM